MLVRYYSQPVLSSQEPGRRGEERGGEGGRERGGEKGPTLFSIAE